MSKVIFSEELDKRLLEMIDPDFDVLVYTRLDEGVELKDLIYHEPSEYDDIDKSFIKDLETHNICIKEPFIGHICDTSKIGDYTTVLLNAKYYIAVYYYSACSHIAGYNIWKWKDDEKEFFDENMDFLDVLTQVCAKERD